MVSSPADFVDIEKTSGIVGEIFDLARRAEAMGEAISSTGRLRKSAKNLANAGGD
jgi:hypothetical protein